MGRYLLRSTGVISTDTVGASEVQTIDLNDIATADTFKLTFNSHESGTVTFAADMTDTILAALEGLDDFVPGDLSVAKGAGQTYAVTFLSTGAYAGMNAGAITITSQSGFTPTGVTETTSGRSEKTVSVPLGTRFGRLMAVRWGLFVNGSTNELVLTDARGVAVYSVTGKDTNVSGAKLRAIVGGDGQDQSGNAAANVLHQVVESPISVRVRNGAGIVSPASGTVELFIDSGIGGRILKRSTGTIATDASGDVSVSMSMGSTVAKVLQVQLEGFDTSTDFSITDVNGATVYAKTAVNATTAVTFPLGYDGEDQAGNSAADSLEGVFRGPLTVTIANGGASTTGSVTLWTEI